MFVCFCLCVFVFVSRCFVVSGVVYSALFELGLAWIHVCSTVVVMYDCSLFCLCFNA